MNSSVWDQISDLHRVSPEHGSVSLIVIRVLDRGIWLPTERAARLPEAAVVSAWFSWTVSPTWVRQPPGK